MKKKLFLIIIIVIIILVIIYFFIKKNTLYVNIDTSTKVEAIFEHNSISVHQELSADDILAIQNIFNGKILYKDNPSCGFRENVSIIFNNKDEFWIANDTCPVIYYKNKDKYFRLSDKEIKEFKAILAKYGFYWPCV